MSLRTSKDGVAEVEGKACLARRPTGRGGGRGDGLWVAKDLRPGFRPLSDTHLLSQIQERGRGRVGFGEGKTKDASYERAITLPLLRLNLPQYVFHAKGYFGKGLWHLT